MTLSSTNLDFRTWLNELDADALKKLLTLRPDTAHPLPPSMSALAARLLLPGSMHLAVRNQDALGLAVLQACFAGGGNIEPLDAPKVVDTIMQSEAYKAAGADQRLKEPELVIAVTARVERLIAAALCFGTPQRFMVITEVEPLLPHELNLLSATADQTAQIAELPANQRRILDTLAQSGGYGNTRDAAPDADPTRPIPQLISKGLLDRVSSTSVVLPHSVRLAIEPNNPTARLVAQVSLFPPNKLGTLAAPGDYSPIDAGQGLEVVRLITLLLEELGERPQPLLKTGEVGMRSLATMAKILQVDEPTIIRLISLAYAASLVAPGDPTPAPEGAADHDYLAPTTLSTLFHAAALDVQWAWLLHCWWNLAGMRFWRISKDVKIFSAESFQEDLIARRQQLLKCALERPADVLAQFLFEHPAAALRNRGIDYEALLEEARWLGVLGPNNEATGVLAVLEAATVGLVDSSLEDHIPESLASYLGQHTPAVVNYLIAQADMTILAPGPLPVELGKKMALLAERESTGLATTYRLSGASIRRGLDSGMSPAEIIGLLTEHVVGELPEAMRYLIEDTASHHGQVRGGAALSYVSAQDPAVIAALCHSDRAAEIGLQQLAPTVAVAQVPLVQLMRAAEQAGVHVVAQDATGATVSMRPAASLVPTPVHRQTTTTSPAQQIARAVEMLQSSTRGPQAPQETPVDVLRLAIREKKTVTLTFVDSNGSATHRTVMPIALTAGQLSAVAQSSGVVEHFLLHRITAVQ